MAQIANNTRIKLGASKPKKDAVVDTPGTPAATDEVAIWAASAIDEAFTQQIVGDFHKLYRFAKSNMPAIAAAAAGEPMVQVYMPLGGSDTQIVIGAPGTPSAGDVRLEIGAQVAAGSKSHFLHRTFIRLVERWLEESKQGPA